MIILKSPVEIEKMRDAGAMAAEVLQILGAAISPGISTHELDEIAYDFIMKQGGRPSFKGYKGYPASICASVNEVVVHGIPSRKIKLQKGDIISIDVGVEYGGYHGDNAYTYQVGAVAPEVVRLLEVTQECLCNGIAQAVAGNRMGDISSAVQTTAEAAGFSVVRDLIGHGIGQSMHEPPDVPNFGPPNRGIRLKEGMTIAIEPMINQGTEEVTFGADGWTVRTADLKPSAHFEHTVAITKDGPQVLTLSGMRKVYT
ncbi:MAG: type I methionyl aminopeptidase [Christensenellales bacterium]|jgi:methionyl aminopeptidase